MIESEERSKIFQENCELITESINELTIIINQVGEIEYINNLPLIKSLGYKSDDLIGNSWLNYVHSEDRETAINVLESCTEGKPVVQQLRLKHANGIYKNFKFSCKLTNESKGFLIFLRPEQRLKESNEFYKTILDGVINGVWVTNKDDIIFFTNKGMETIAEIPTAQIVDVRVLKDFPESTLKYFRSYYLKAKEALKPVYYDVVPVKTPGGRQSYQSGWLIPRTQDGKYDGIICTVEDVTERIEYEQELKESKAQLVKFNKELEQKVEERTSALKESEEKFRTIAEQSFTGILITVDNKIEYVNNTLLQIFEYSNEEIANWTKDNIVQMIHPDDLQFLREYREKLRRGDPNVKPYYSYRVFTKSGTLKWVDQFSTVINYMGSPAELVTVMDITEKKVAEQELVKLNSLKSEFMRRTSHELKTPLVSIKGYSDLLLSVHKEKLDDYVLASVVEIKQGCERLESLIQDILNTAELESGTVQLKKIVDDLSFFIKLSVRELRGLARLRNHTINLTNPDKLITSFEPEQMHQVISNLINNAIKYTPPDGTIEIVSEIKDNLIIVSIKDSGIGITKEEKERLFTQFGKIERYGQGLDIISDGSGLGLYISKKIVELHGGKIWAESEGRNKGSTFYFTLPIIQETIE